MAITDTQQAAQSAASAAVSAAEAKQYAIEVSQNTSDANIYAQEAETSASNAAISSVSASASSISASNSAASAESSSVSAAASASQAAEYADNASDYAQNKFTFYKTSSDPDGTIAGLAATTDGQSFWVAQGPDALSAAWQYQNNAGVAVLQAKQPGTAAVTGTIREFPTLTAAQADADAGNIMTEAKVWVTNSTDTTLADEYINNAGTLEATGRKMPSQGYIDEIIPDISSTPQKVPLFFDENNNVPVWLERGELNAVALSPNIRDVSDTDNANKIPLFVDDDENVPVWLSGGKLNASALADDIRDTSDTDYPAKVPLFVDDNNNVPVWLENGKLNAVALHEDLLRGLMTADEFSRTLLERTLYTSGSTAWLFRAKKAKLDIGIGSKLKIGFTGDSWTEHSTIPQVFADYFYAKYGKSGDGWIQLNIDNPNQLNGIVLTRDGWSIYDASTNVNPTFPTSMDGQYIYAAGTAATLSLSNFFDTSIKIFYYDGTGTFRYSVNGGVPVVVTGAGTNKIVSVTVSGLNISTATTLNIDLTGNTGTVVIYGFYAEGTGNGVEINKMGNGGITAPQYIKTLSYLPQTASVVAPDILIMIIGTNDFRTNVPLQGFRDGLTWWLNAWKVVIPDAAIIMVAPSQSNATGAYPLTDYRDIMRDVAVSAGVEFYSLYDFMNTAWTKSNAQGLWLNSLHLSNVGARFLLNQLNSHFLEQ
ncbi:SGNH/GDSL hydrolase family protein [Klebsiella pneumoniae]|uniref:SGNH/GDSL hydrolase family protein n=1 Tax=Klebsiella pneumoniae TaxID=573 RepID=UPI0021184EEC|nr:SGNH/GDSL hydrolase family protein [Klebsiella pneumoniae]MCQ8649247.1 SGNH/GDSL hydrolase family protein [Klebsiella pneumoniae]